MNDEQWTRLFVVRHGETQWNFEGRWQGWQDSDLTERGRHQAAEAGEILKPCGASIIYASDAGRAQETAQIISEAVGVDVKIDSALRERFYGDFEGLSSEEIDARFPGTRYEAGRDRRDTWRPSGGESLVEVTSRVITFIRQVAEMHPGETVIMVSHGGVLRVLDAVASRETLENTWDRAPGNCAIFELDANSKGDLRVVRHFAVIE